MFVPLKILIEPHSSSHKTLRTRYITNKNAFHQDARTVRCSGCFGGCPHGGPPRGVYPRGVSPQEGGVCLGVVCPEGCLPGRYTPLDQEADTLPHRGQTDTCENMTFPEILSRTVISTSAASAVQSCRKVQHT